jgi:hypothetical protein
MRSRGVNRSRGNIERLFHDVGKMSESGIELVCNNNRVQGFCFVPGCSLGAGWWYVPSCIVLAFSLAAGGLSLTSSGVREG